MVNFYVFRIKNDLKKYADVPDLWKSKVLAEFKRQVADGEITKEEFERYIGEPYREN